MSYSNNSYNEAPEELSTETIESLTAEIEELNDWIFSEKESMERFMLETGGESDYSDRMQEGIDRAKGELAELKGRLQELLDAQEALNAGENLNPNQKDTQLNIKQTPERTSVKDKLRNNLAKIAAKGETEPKPEREKLIRQDISL